MGAPAETNAVYDAALARRQALMGDSGAKALARNFKVARIAAFACIGGVLYGYNQGMFSGILAMPAFGKRTGQLSSLSCFYRHSQERKKTLGLC
jgi:hypothetical protein